MREEEKAAVVLHETTNQLIKARKRANHLPVNLVSQTVMAGRDAASGSWKILPRLSDDSQLLKSNQSEIVTRITPSLAVIPL